MTRVEKIEAEMAALYQSKTWSMEHGHKLNMLRAAWMNLKLASA